MQALTQTLSRQIARRQLIQTSVGRRQASVRQNSMHLYPATNLLLSLIPRPKGGG